MTFPATNVQMPNYSATLLFIYKWKEILHNTTKDQEELLADPRRVAALILLRQRLQRRRTRLWVHPINERRHEQGAYYHLVQELHLDENRYHQYFRMSPGQMEEVLSYVGEDITRCTTNFRTPIEPKQRLAVTIRYLASGDSITSLAFSYRLGRSTVCEAIRGTCEAINKRMTAKYLPKPTEADWRDIAEKFHQRWNFPLCLGAIDGKHINIQAPRNSGSLHFNYKRAFSIVLMALVDAEYRFRVVRVGDYGKSSDGGVFAKSELGKGLEANTLNVPKNEVIPGAEDLGELPFTVVGDAAFPLKTYLMRPYPGREQTRSMRVFNYRLSRARNVVENAFGILASRWRILLNRINLDPRVVDALVLTTCILHNFLLKPSQNQQLLDEIQATNERLDNVANMGGNRGSGDAYAVRNKLTAYFNSPQGRVEWQDLMV